VDAVMRPQVMQVNPGTPAERAGLEARDVFIEVGGEAGLSQPEIISRIQGSANQPLALVVERNGSLVNLEATPEGSAGAGLIGGARRPSETRRVDPGFAEAFQMSTARNWEGTQLIGRALRGLFTAETPMRQLAGPVAIAEMSG